MSYQHLLVEQDGGVLVVTLNRPKVLNALNAALIGELDAVVAGAETDAAVRAVVITGAGRAFAAGADVAELATDSPAEAYARARRTQHVFARIERLGAPVIAAVNGFALGGGCELAMACAIRLASTAATFGQPEINLGLMPGYGATVRLPRIVGRARATEWLLTGDTVTAEGALAAGLVNRVVSPTDLMSVSRDLAAALASKPRHAVRHLLDAVAGGSSMTAEAAAEHEAALFGLTFSTDDMREGTRAFLEKRRPVFSR